MRCIHYKELLYHHKRKINIFFLYEFRFKCEQNIYQKNSKPTSNVANEQEKKKKKKECKQKRNFFENLSFRPFVYTHAHRCSCTAQQDKECNPINTSFYLTTQTECLLFKQCVMQLLCTSLLPLYAHCKQMVKHTHTIKFTRRYLRLTTLK